MLQAVISHHSGDTVLNRHEFAIAPGTGPFTIGRSEKCSIPIGSFFALEETRRGISNIHATIYEEDGRLLIRDGNGSPSTNGIFYNGTPVKEPLVLRAGDAAPLSGEIVLFRIGVDSVRLEVLARELEDSPADRLTYTGDDLVAIIQVQMQEMHIQQIEMREQQASMRSQLEALSVQITASAEQLEARRLADIEQDKRIAAHNAMNSSLAKQMKNLTVAMFGLAAIVLSANGLIDMFKEKSARDELKGWIEFVVPLFAGGSAFAISRIGVTPDPSQPNPPP